jgi:hypothetical protein
LPWPPKVVLKSSPVMMKSLPSPPTMVLIP